VAGYRCLVIADHVDHSVIDFTVPRLVKVCRELAGLVSIRVKPGAELTHVRPEHFARLTKEARRLGAEVVLGHGETLVEPVISGTNRAAIEAGVDVLAHPGLISMADARLAARKGVCLEISGRQGHSLTNGHVAAVARAAGARLVFGSDSHIPGDLVPRPMAERIAAGAGLSPGEIKRMFARAEAFF
jgi:histidinol phosphatase-like PHP family hydrolase